MELEDSSSLESKIFLRALLERDFLKSKNKSIKRPRRKNHTINYIESSDNEEEKDPYSIDLSEDEYEPSTEMDDLDSDNSDDSDESSARKQKVYVDYSFTIIIKKIE